MLQVSVQLGTTPLVPGQSPALSPRSGVSGRQEKGVSGFRPEVGCVLKQTPGTGRLWSQSQEHWAVVPGLQRTL